MFIRLSDWVLDRLHPGVVVLAASLLLTRFEQLPSRWWLTGCALTGCLLCATGLRQIGRPRWRKVARWAGSVGLFLLALAWCGWTATQALDERIDPLMEGQDITAVGLIEQMPQQDDLVTRFVFLVLDCESSAPPCRSQVRWRLSWFIAAQEEPRVPLLPGQVWRLTARLRQPHTPLNPGGFDGELRALEDRIAAVGTVRLRAGNRRSAQQPAALAGPQLLVSFKPTARTLIERLRSRVRDAIATANREAPQPVSGVLQALVVGDQSAISAGWWDRFNRTGVAHLISISGMHVTMLAAGASWLVARLWSSPRLAARCRRLLVDRLSRPQACWLAALLVAFGYSALAGWGVPAQRTCWMLAIAGWANLSGRASTLFAVMASSAALIVLLDPWAVASAGFWLSFGAVAALVYAHQRQRPGRERRSGWSQALSAQAVVTLVMLPLGAVFFSNLSLVSPLANALAIPLVSLLVTPLALAGGLLETLVAGTGAACWWLTGLALRCLLASLQWLDGLPMASVVVGQPQPLALLLAGSALLILLSPLGGRARYHACWALAPVLLTPVDEPAAARMRVTAIDIGQGTAVLVETPGYRMLYDTGPAYPGERDAGSRLILPFLHARGIRSLDLLVVSHQDNDHAGGALSVLSGVRVDKVSSSLPQDHAVVLAAATRHEPCVRGRGWVAGDYHFDWLHPAEQDETSLRSPTNARSCVLRIRGPAGSVLLPGDLERAQEARLLALYSPSELKADLLFAPHHGSATSSSQPFLDAVDPALVVFQVGYRNRFHHPDAKVWGRYARRASRLLRSDDDGAIRIELGDGEPRVWRLRHDERRYWRVRAPERLPP